MDDLLLSGGIDAMHVDGARLHDVEAERCFALVKEIAALGDWLDRCDVSNDVQFRQGNASEELAASKRVDYPDLFEFGQCRRHAGHRLKLIHAGSKRCNG